MSAWSATTNMSNFSYNAYNELDRPWTCIKKGSIYTNPNTTINYFSKDCLDPYTGYNFWYRKFADQKQYLNCYYLPYPDPMLGNGGSYGYVTPGKSCKYTGKKDGWNTTDGGFRFYE